GVQVGVLHLGGEVQVLVVPHQPGLGGRGRLAVLPEDGEVGQRLGLVPGRLRQVAVDLDVAGLPAALGVADGRRRLRLRRIGAAAGKKPNTDDPLGPRWARQGALPGRPRSRGLVRKWWCSSGGGAGSSRAGGGGWVEAGGGWPAPAANAVSLPRSRNSAVC